MSNGNSLELARLIETLADPAAYPHPVETIQVRHTHISVVFLAGPFAYKVKKPVNLGFLDFSTLEKRHHYCQEEVRLNRRLAPEVYRGVVPVTRAASGLRLEGQGAVVEWAVQMERLPEDATLQMRLQHQEVGVGLIETLARTIASFHAHAEGGKHVADFGRFDVVARNARENFDQVAPQVGITLSRAVFERLRELTDAALVRLRPVIERRAEHGVPRDTHGDLRLEHVYVFPHRGPGAELVIIDCIEFNERFRFADPVADMAFLAMDLRWHGRRDLAQAFAEEYFRASGDEEGRALLPFYLAYRAAVRGKVEGLELLEKEIPEGERVAAMARARAHWLLALEELEDPGRRPCLVLVGGLPGSGKSAVSQGLTERANFRLLRSDVVRKELAGLPAQASGRATSGEGIYTPAWTERTYAECLARAESLLFDGNRVIVDATFAEESKRRAFLDAAARLRVPAVFLLCQADPAVVRARLEQRRGDASDADWSIYEQAASRWQAIGPVTREALGEVPTGGTKAEVLARALELLPVTRSAT